MTLRTIPVIPRTTRPSIAGAPVWYAEATMARTQLDISITIPTADSRKLILLWGSNGGEFPTAITFDPAGEGLEMRQVAAGVNDTLRTAAYYLDAPPSGPKMVRIETANAVWSVARLVVVRDARAGDPWGDTEATSGSGCSILIEPSDAFSETFDLVLDDTHGLGDLTTFDGQIPLNEALINSSFLAATSGRAHAHNGQTSMGWNTGNAATTLLQVAVNTLFSAGQIATSGPLSLWHLDETAGTVFADTQGISNLGLSEGGIAPGADPLLAGGGKSLSVRNAGLSSSNHLEWQVPTWTFSIYCQPRSSPSSGSNRIIAAKDVNLPPGGWSIEQYDDGGISRLRAYIRNASGGVGSAIWIGSQTGQGTLSLNVAHRIDLTFDGTTARLYLDRSEVASSSDAALHGMQDNAQPLDVAHRIGAGGYFDGILDRAELREGALSALEIAAAPGATTITDPGVPSSITAIDDPQGLVAPSSNVEVDVTANDVGVGAGSLNIDITQQPSAGVLTILNDNTPNARVRISTTAAPAQTTQYSGRYHVSEAGGAFSNEATISWRVQGAAGPGGYTPFPFVTDPTPPTSHAGVAARPGYSPTDPRSASIIDPMTGIEIFRVGGLNGETVFINGTQNSGLKFPCRLKPENNPRIQAVFNADSTLLMVDRRYDLDRDSGDLRAYMIDITGTRGASKPWRIIRASNSGNFGDIASIRASGSTMWDMNNPLRQYACGDDGMYEWWPIGANGHSVGEINLLWPWPSGFSEFNNVRRGSMQSSYDGNFWIGGCRRNSDGRWGGFRLDLRDGTHGPFVPNPFVPPLVSASLAEGSNRRLAGCDARGIYGWFEPGTDNSPNGDLLPNRRWYNTITGEFACDESIAAGPLHHDNASVDGQSWAVGQKSGDGVQDVYRMTNLATGQQRIVANTLPGNNPEHNSTRAWLHTFERYPTPSSGSTQGLRYSLFCKSGNAGGTAGVLAVRLGLNDSNQVRYLFHHRSERTTNANEAHVHCSPDWDYCAWGSNWHVPGQVSDGDVHAYVAIIPDGFKSPNNDGS